MESFFFRVEHGLLRSESFKALGGSAIKVYLVIGLYSDFGSGWAYPSIRTIARQAGLSRQTVLVAIAELTSNGLVATSKSRGKSTAYKVIREAPPKRPEPKKAGPAQSDQAANSTVPIFLADEVETVPDSLDVHPRTGPESWKVPAQWLGPTGPEAGPKREQPTRQDSNTIPLPGTPFQIDLEGRLVVVADLQSLLEDQGIPRRLADRLVARAAPEGIAKVLLNATYLRSLGKLQNGPGYIRAGVEDGYDLLPQVAAQVEVRRRELEGQIRASESKREQSREEAAKASEEAAMGMVIDQLRPEQLQSLVRQAVASLPEPIVRRNPTLSNPFVRTRVYELAGGDPAE